MLNEMSVSVKSKNKASRYVFLGLIGTSMIFVCAANLGVGYSGILWVFALGFITAAIYVYNRYVGSEYYYEVKMDGGKESFLVSMKVGKTVKTLARVDLCSVTEVRKMSGKEYRKHKCERGVYKYPYFPTMFADAVYMVSVRSEYESADIFIEADEDFASALTCSPDC